ncbi:NADH-quinone oxidoreductase subunit NuoG [Zoogloea sp. LCSB751]|uniref:NADH-quinone oxidoreductase subunit NuoG n=1 Tax=Zoogloea sp. LCSB751 TaxID=1965277 RepID=UPI0009A48335|nr:NADH-quinone oxidoreductase subunit NuoG [Zoogloea sp. LCSB751]
MLEIEIDGKQLQVPDGSTVMEAASKVGAYVPHFCYHKKLSIAANCRMCLVQVEKAPKPLPACATPVTNGMKVWTHSEQAVKAQKGVMEFLLINHPLDCPICDQGGECQLQDLSVGYGGVESRYQEGKRVVGNKDLGPLVSTDMTRCINCTRCVRFTTEIAGLMELGQAFRGEHAEIMPFVEKTIDSELSGNIIDLCPVGALTSKPFRFGARAWEMSRRKSVSPHDSLGSNLVVQVKNDVVKRVLPLENEALNECWLSDKDRFSYEALNGEERLTRPQVKQGGKWVATDWQTALEYVANALKLVRAEHGAEAIGALASPHSTLEELHLLQALVRGLGSDNIDFRLRQTDFSIDGRRAGVPWLGLNVAEIGSLDRLFVVGSFFRKDHPLVAQRVRQAVKRGLKVSVLNPVIDDWQFKIENKLQVKPSGVVTALVAVAKALAQQSDQVLADAFAAAAASVEVDAAAVAIAGSLASGKQVAVWLGNYAQQHAEASKIEAVAQEIARLSKGKFGLLGEAANTVGAYLVGGLPSKGGKNAAAMLSAPLKAYVLFGLDAELDTQAGQGAVETLGKAETVIVLSAFKSEAALAYADVLLPIAPFTETAGTFVNTEGRAQAFYPVVKTAGEARPGWKVLRVLGQLIGLDGFGFDKVEDVRQVILGAAQQVDSSRLNSAITVESFELGVLAQGVERVADIPIYAADPIARRSAPLQKTRDGQAPALRVSAATAAKLGLEAGGKAKVRSAAGAVTVPVAIDDGVVDGSICLAGAHADTSALGGLHGEVSVERV